VITSAITTSIGGARIAVVTGGIYQTLTATTSTTIDGAVVAGFRAVTGSITTVVAGTRDTHILGRAGSTAISLAVVGPANQAGGTLGIRITIPLTLEARTINTTEVVLTQGVAAASTAAIAKRHTNVSKAIA
jgi:hypothetical protein